jgi:hypothetical protein
LNHPILRRFTIAAGTLSLAAYACGGDTGESGTGSLSVGGSTSGTGGTIPGIGGGTPTGGNGTAGSGTGGTPGSGGGSGGTIVVGTGGATGGTGVVDEDAACGTGMANAALRPVNMLVMFDRSGSMLDCTDGSNPDNGEMCAVPTRWDVASAALKGFFSSPGAADLGVALRFFPHDSPAVGCSGGNNGQCDEQACSQVLVDMGTLLADVAPTDMHEGDLIAAVDASIPMQGGMMGGGSQGTPIYAALSGALIWATAYQQANPDQRTIVVFVTDGEPNGCNEDFDDIADLAADALADAGVSTYMIGLTDVNGMGVNQDDMDQVADAGGTTQSFFVSDGVDATQQLIDTFNQIRGMAIACNFPVPESTTSGVAIDPTMINVNYTPGGGTEVPLGIVASAADCGMQQAWYYDDPADPSTIILCPSACDTVTADPNATIQILAGCAPRPPEPVE